MSEKTDLDLKTLEHVRDLLIKEACHYSKMSDNCAEDADYYDADRFDAKRSAIQHFKRVIINLIEQQEV